MQAKVILSWLFEDEIWNLMWCEGLWAAGGRCESVRMEGWGLVGAPGQAGVKSTGIGLSGIVILGPSKDKLSIAATQLRPPSEICQNARLPLVAISKSQPRNLWILLASYICWLWSCCIISYSSHFKSQKWRKINSFSKMSNLSCHVNYYQNIRSRLDLET